MNRPTLVATLACLALVLAPLHAHAHSGGLDSKGCHTESATGSYHCHNGSSGGGGGGSTGGGSSEAGEVDRCGDACIGILVSLGLLAVAGVVLWIVFSGDDDGTSSSAMRHIPPRQPEPDEPSAVPVVHVGLDGASLRWVW